MGTNYDKAYEANDGFQITDGPYITGGVSSPVGLDEPVQTVYIQVPATGGCITWRKFNTGVNDWVRQDQWDFSLYAEAIAATTPAAITTKVSVTIPANYPSGTYRLSTSWVAVLSGLLSVGVARVVTIQGATTNVIFTRALTTDNQSEGIIRRFAFTTGTAMTVAVQASQTGTGTTTISDAAIEVARIA